MPQPWECPKLVDGIANALGNFSQVLLAAGTEECHSRGTDSADS